MGTPRASHLFTICAPSGAGKSSLIKALLEQHHDIALSVSFTTRAPRTGEQNGREYHFTTVADFKKRKQEGEFLEWAEVHGNFYGTSRKAIDEQLKTGQDVLLEIDWQGMQQIKRLFPDAISIFILPPSIQTLEDRLLKRGQDSSEVIAQRMQAATEEITHASECDYVIINENFDDALKQLAAIISAARCAYTKQAVRHTALFSALGIRERKTHEV